MNYSIKTIPQFDQQYKRLIKKYPSFKKEFKGFIQSLRETPQLSIYDKSDKENLSNKELEELLKYIPE